MKSQLTALLSLALPFAANAYSYVGCYSDPGSLDFEGGYTFQSDGYCTEVCSRLEKPVMATNAGTKCFCGDEVPPSSVSVPKSKCNVACAGFPNVMCGGDHAWSVYADGPQQSASNSTSTTTTGASTSATSGSTSVPNTESATGTLRPSTASVSSGSASATTSTSGASRRYGFF
ncbi:predicted protein [Aspergillus terreus NIH2624]|uniref:WSC domain-containing protein n=1 Tax=Aspergillus terreus (strain NIH 2624 / FGSC A1156) TaxID=341663 RepID=Q0C9Z0_ASPTN|nr:uncharacterized protein ATEG_09494 [Aspergillus terreus NIH2624]EAU29685.1 predicted protein [Aspergillus terreus NIH2624]